MKIIYNLLTFDYEIFGNGFGDIKCCLLDPTYQLMELLARHSVKATFFVDICLIWALQENKKKMNFKHLDYSPLEVIEKQLLEIINQGHDVQLHAHPQFIDSIYENGRFKVNIDNWRISDLPLNSNNHLSISSIIRNGKKTLEDLIRIKFNDYRVIAFRAGGLCSRPEVNLLGELKDNNFRFDFSPMVNLKIDSGRGIVDFTDCFKNSDPIPVGKTYKDRDPKSRLIAIPIYGASMFYFLEIFKKYANRFFNINNYKNRIWHQKRPLGCESIPNKSVYIQSQKVDFLKYFRKLTTNYILDADFYTMRWCMENALKKIKNMNKNIYMIGIGHSKHLGTLSHLEMYLKWLNKNSHNRIIQHVNVRDIENNNFF
jgi:hypothetical protein